MDRLLGNFLPSSLSRKERRDMAQSILLFVSSLAKVSMTVLKDPNGARASRATVRRRGPGPSTSISLDVPGLGSARA